MIGDDLRCHLGERTVGLRQILAVAIAQLGGIANILFGARHLSAELVVAPLYPAKRLAQLAVKFTLFFQRCLAGPLLCQFLLHSQLSGPRRIIVHSRTAIELAHAQRQQLSIESPFADAQILVTPRRDRLTLQMANLLVDFVA